MSELADINGCVIIPTYNNEKTLAKLIDDVLIYTNQKDVIVVNDGATDSTSHILELYKDKITIVGYSNNVGKGNALKLGFKTAIEKGYTNAITIDSDGQHFPDDLPVFFDSAVENPGSLLMGSRNMDHENVPGKSSFGNKFSNFWFKVETGLELPDTQTGYRLYPLESLKKIKLFTTKFETEIEVIVKMAWKDVNIIPVNVKVLYDYEERVTHFRPFKDFTRISILNTYLVTLTLLYYLPKRLFKASLTKKFWIKLKSDIIQPNETNLNKSLSISFGFFMGIVPIWGFQLLVGIPLAMLFKLNKAIFIAAANISIPPMIPLLIWISYYVGSFMFEDATLLPYFSSITLDSIKNDVVQYIVGAVIFAFLAAIISFLISFILLSVFRRKKILKS
ncbi:MAG: DUF2062 domain-containing protein [Bacteroidetes bacterium]|nr:DUF2062 domain-containing protein [Bacteroidota bacterium]